MKTKICTKCRIEKPLSEFAKAKTGKFGVRGDCNVCRKNLAIDYYLKNKDEILKTHNIYYLNNKEKTLLKCKEYRDKNKEKSLKYQKEYYKKHKIEKIKKQRDRRDTDITFKILNNLRRRLNLALNGLNKSLSTMMLLGCEVDYLMFHLQEQFQQDMNWNNHGRGKGKWHIDHIKPCTSFDLSKPEEQLLCFNYKNLQPLWEKDNLSKGSRYDS